MNKKALRNRIDALSVYDGKYVCIRDTYGNTFSGLAEYGNYDFLECEWGGEEDGIFIEDVLIYNSQIESIDEIIPHGTAELWTEHLILRRYRFDDIEQLYNYFGTDPDMYKYSGWNPYTTPEMAKETVLHFIESYEDNHSYSWVMDVNGDDVIAGTIGAYDYKGDQIEVGFNVRKGWQGRGFATEALKKVLEYLTENEDIPCVTAWCAEENICSRRVLEKTGMKPVQTVKDGLKVGDKVYDKLIYEYRNPALVPEIKEPAELGERYMKLQDMLKEEWEEGRKEGLEEGRKESIYIQKVLTNSLSVAEAADRLGITAEDFQKIIDSYPGLQASLD